MERTFKIGVQKTTTLEFTDLYARLSKQSQRELFKDFNVILIFLIPEKIYRPPDKDLRSIAKRIENVNVLRIEKKNVANYVTVVSSNHKRKDITLVK